ncbi:MAG: DUF4386 family protein [Bacillota bacterium]
MSQTNDIFAGKVLDSSLRGLLKTGGIAAMAAGLLFRRNLAAEVGIFNHHYSPETVKEWFELLQSNRLLGLTNLNIFDLVNYLLVGVMLVALYALLRSVNKVNMTVAAVSGIVGITVFFATNTAFSMLTLSNQYSAASTEAQKDLLLAAGQAMLALITFSTGSLISLLLVAAACLLISFTMLKSGIFSKAAAYIGVLASILDLTYCIAFSFVPADYSGLLAVCFIPAAGLFWMIWHIMIGWKLFRIGRSIGKEKIVANSQKYM